MTMLRRPLIYLLIAALLLITFIPQISLWLPQVFGYTV